MNTTRLPKTHRQIAGRCCALVALAAVFALPSLRAFDFVAADTFSKNFRQLQKTGNSAWSWDKSTRSMKISPVVSGAYLYTDNPASENAPIRFTVSATETLTVKIPLAIGTPKSSIGIYIIDATSKNKGYLALYNLDNAGTDDAIRFVTDGMPYTSGAGSIAKAESHNAPGLGLGEPGTLVLTYALDAKNKGVMTLTMLDDKGQKVHSASHAVSDKKPHANIAIGLRIAAQAGKGEFILKGFEAATAAK